MNAARVRQTRLTTAKIRSGGAGHAHVWDRVKVETRSEDVSIAVAGIVGRMAGSTDVNVRATLAKPLTGLRGSPKGFPRVAR